MLNKLQDPSEKTLGLLLLAPAFALLLLIVAYPIAKLVYNSLFDIDKTGAFIGLRNYVDVWQDPLFWSATANTLLMYITLKSTGMDARIKPLGLACKSANAKCAISASCTMRWQLSKYDLPASVKSTRRVVR